MKKKNLFRSFLWASMALFMLSACGGKQKQTTPAVSDGAGTKAISGSKVAYVDIDTLMSQYNFCKDYTLLMTQKGENIRATLNNKGRALQQAAADFQRKIQANAITQERAQEMQMSLQKQQMSLQELQERLSREFDSEQQQYNNEMRDSIQKFLKEYNKTKGYDLIISKAGDNILLANKTLDITSDVVAGLNKRYKPSKELVKSGIKSDKK